MTEIILAEHGVVLQYMGDGILACWNVPFDDPRHVDRACRAALSMARELGRATGGWACGVGVHTGRVVAGAIGSKQVFSYGVLGATVNQASRVEGLTKLLGVPILVSAEVAARVGPDAARAVRLGRFVPAGMTAALELHALFEPGTAPAAELAYGRALESFEAGRWEEASQRLAGASEPFGPARFLATEAERMRAEPPEGWNGVIVARQK